MRRLRDLVLAHQSDLGGEAILSAGQVAILRRAALLQLQLEMMETKFACRADGVATSVEIEVRTAGNLRRLLESLGLNEGRKQRNVTPAPDQINQLIDGVLRQSRQQSRVLT